MEVSTFCRVCNAMCGLIITVDNDVITKIRGDESHAISRGYTCPKGRALGELHHDPKRLNAPFAQVEGSSTRVSWETALNDISARVQTSLQESGPDSVAMYLASGSAFDTAGRRASERFLSVLGSRQKYTATTIDTPSKPLVAEVVGGWSGLTPIWDHESSKLLLLFGSNPIVSHGHSNAIPDPVRRLREFQDGGGSIWVIDPRQTETARLADHQLHVQPGTDWLLLGWLVRRLLQSHPAAATLADRTTGHEALIDCVEPFTDALITRHCDVSLESLEELHNRILSAGRVSALTGTGVSMSATANVAEYLLWCLHIVTDSYDRHGGMWFNPGFLNQLDERSLPVSDGTPEPGPKSRPLLPRRFGEYPCAALIPEIEAGNITTLFVVGGNPITALPDSDRTRRALRSLSSLVVIDILPTETSEIASHVLPAVDQLERSDLTWLLDSYQLAVAAQYTDALVEPVAERKPVWWIFSQLAERLGFEILPAGLRSDDTTEDDLLRSLLDRSRNADSLRSNPRLVVDSGAVYGWVTERVLPEGRWRLEATAIAQQLGQHLSGLPSANSHALTLLPSRRLRRMNSQFRDLALPSGAQDCASIQASPSVVESLGTPELATVSSESGTLTARLVADSALRDDVVVVTHGWGEANVCALTSADDNIDPLSGMVLQSGLKVSLRAQT